MAKSKNNQPEKTNNESLKGFDITVNEFGEIVTSHKIDQINEFLDENVNDKKLEQGPPAEEE